MIVKSWSKVVLSLGSFAALSAAAETIEIGAPKRLGPGEYVVTYKRKSDCMLGELSIAKRAVFSEKLKRPEVQLQIVGPIQTDVKKATVCVEGVDYAEAFVRLTEESDLRLVQNFDEDLDEATRREILENKYVTKVDKIEREL